MKSTILLLALIYSTTNLAFAQQDTTTLYQAPKGFLKDPVRSKWVRKVEKQDNLWVVKLLNKKDVLQEKISFANEDLSIRKGPYERYDKGILLEEGNYEIGYKIGTWSKYYPDKQLKEKVNYKWDKTDGAIIAYWDNKQLKKEGEYKLGKKIGKWKMFLQNGKLVVDENYDQQGKLLESAYFDAEGNSLAFPMILISPSYPRGMPAFYKTLAEVIRYPVNAVKNRIQGKVVLEFTVMLNGNLEDIKVINSPDEELSQEAVRVLKLMKGWKPGEELGEPVKMRYTTSINFTLN